MRYKRSKEGNAPCGVTSGLGGYKMRPGGWEFGRGVVHWERPVKEIKEELQKRQEPHASFHFVFNPSQVQR